MRTSLSIIFVVSLAVAILLGIILVFGQAIGLFLQSDVWIIASKGYFAKSAYIASGIAGIAAFLISYLPKSAASETK